MWLLCAKVWCKCMSEVQMLLGESKTKWMSVEQLFVVRIILNLLLV